MLLKNQLFCAIIRIINGEKMKKVLATIVIMVLICVLCACSFDIGSDDLYVEIDANDMVTLDVGESMTFGGNRHPSLNGFFTWSIDNSDIVSIRPTLSSCTITAKKVGRAILTLSVGNYSDCILIDVVDETNYDEEATITLSCDKDEIYINGISTLSFGVTPEKYQRKVQFRVESGEEYVVIINNGVKGVKEGVATIVAYVDKWVSNTITITVIDNDSADPYEDMSRVDFYSAYTPATSYTDAINRAKHGFMAGDIETPCPSPTYSSYMPTQNGAYIRNTSSIYEDDGNTYVVLDSYGNVYKKIYKGGGYITLEDVAAYVLAFNDIPANYDEDKSPSVTQSIWGKYLRANYSNFSGNTRSYPYEPELPNISGCGGSFQYKELDIGTTGTDTGGGYAVREYNNGTSIVRGAARIVHTSYDKNGNKQIDIDERFVFYTYNHYNDFQEYLNYYGGWGEMFGNITGGGILSSKTNYNPTPYVATVKKDLASNTKTRKYRQVNWVVLPSKEALYSLEMIA